MRHTKAISTPMQDSKLPVGQNLARDGDASRHRRVPLLLFFSQDHCGYCDRLEEEILRPMMISGEYEQLIILRKLSIDYGEDVVGFDGHRIDNSDIFNAYDGIVTPMLVVTDGTGRQLTEPLVGINTVEYFGWYLDNAINHALSQLRSSNQ